MTCPGSLHVFDLKVVKMYTEIQFINKYIKWLGYMGKITLNFKDLWKLQECVTNMHEHGLCTCLFVCYAVWCGQP